MKILVVGAGATGGFFGGRLIEAGADVTFLVRAGQAAQLAAQGLRLVTPKGEIRLTPRTVTAESLTEVYDLVIIAVKAYGLISAMQDFAPAIGPDTVILPLLNGLGHVEVLQSRFGETKVFGGVCAIVAFLAPDGAVVQGADLATLTHGELDGGVTPRAAAVQATLANPGFGASLSSDIRQDLWNKWVMLASLAATTCLMRAPIGEIEAAPGGRVFLLGTLSEAAAVAASSGHPCSDAWLERVRTILTTKGSSMTASMYRDMQSGAPVEVEAILGDLVRRAEALGVPTPRLAAARTALEVYSARRKAPTEVTA